MHLRESQYLKAHTDFFEAFKNYDESGSPRRTACLKYLVLASMLMKSNINPFDSQEAKPYKNDSEIIAMTNLVNAYQSSDIEQFQSILKENNEAIMEDKFIREHIEALLRNIRTKVLLKVIKPYTHISPKVLLKVIKPYTRLRISFISEVLSIPEEEVEKLLIGCILDGTVLGKINQLENILILDREEQSKTARIEALSAWTKQLKNLTERIAFA